MSHRSEAITRQPNTATSEVHQAASLVDFAGKPLIVVRAGRGHDSEWLPAQKALTTLSTNSRQRVVADATHASLVLGETDAAAASQAMRDVVASVRTSQPLALIGLEGGGAEQPDRLAVPRCASPRSPQRT
jgi:hypothetical protein